MQIVARLPRLRCGILLPPITLKDAAELLYSMEAKDISKILSKMTSQKVARLTEILRLELPFDSIE